MMITHTLFTYYCFKLKIKVNYKFVCYTYIYIQTLNIEKTIHCVHRHSCCTSSSTLFVLFLAKKMCKLIDQIKFFHALNLNPVAKENRQRWLHALEKNLLKLHKISECYVFIEKLNEELLFICEKKSNQRKFQRLRIKKKCCIMCQNQ